MAYKEDTESNPFLGYASGPKDSNLGGNPSLNGASLNGTSFDGSLASFHTHFHKAAVAQSPIEVSKYLTNAVKSVSSNTPSHIKQEYFNLAQSMLKRRSNTTLPSIDVTRIELDSNLRSLVDSHPKSKAEIHTEIARKAIGLGELNFIDAVPDYAKFLLLGLALGCVYKKVTSTS